MEQYTVTGMSCAACSARVEKAVAKVPGVTSCSVSLLTNTMGMLKDRETPVLKQRLAASLLFLVPLMYVSMGHMMWNWPVPAVLEGNHVAMGLIQLILTGIVMVVNQKFFISGFRSLLHGAPNMDTLVALGAGAASLTVLLSSKRNREINCLSTLAWLESSSLAAADSWDVAELV